MNNKTKKPSFVDFLKKHWIDIIVIVAAIGLFAWLFSNIYVSFRFGKKFEIFYRNFIVNKGYNRLLLGMKNTAIIAVSGLLIGTLIGIVIAVMNKLTEKRGGVKRKDFSCEGCPSAHLCDKTSCAEITELAGNKIENSAVGDPTAVKDGKD